MKRYLFTASLLLLSLAVVGGLSGERLNAASSAPNAGFWHGKADMPTARFGLAAVEVNNMIYVIGGRQGELL